MEQKEFIAQKTSSGTELRTYRLALAVTGEYTAFHGGTVTGAMAAMNTSMNRINGVYEREVAIRMVLVADNDLLVYTNAAEDPYTNDDGGTLLSENQSNIDAVIGSANYDIGHVFSTAGGGVAVLGSVCRGDKAHGVTGRSAPIGDPFDIDFVAHEIGHQFGATHTFNNSCGGNRYGGGAYEPGSGSTIMAYGGLCAPNLQSSGDGYFHNASYNEIVNFSVNGGGNACATIKQTGNSPPSVTMPQANLSIPISTPFELTMVGSDLDQDALTYIWEQFDLGPATASGDDDLSQPSGNQPIFRSWPPSTTGATRVFPRSTDLIANTTVIGERLPTYARDLTFKATVRDNRAGGGGVVDDSVSYSVTDAAGPFLVLSTTAAYARNTTQTITWDVANTDKAPVNATHVDIFLSMNGGTLYPVTLAEGVLNDGSHEVLLPDIEVTAARFKVKGSDHIFFAISDADFAIENDGDGDGVADSVDAFPDDSDEWVDTDGDGVGNNSDGDDDGDGTPDVSDNCPLLVSDSQVDTDSDGLGDVCDDDDDNDGVLDTADSFPLDSSEAVDTDGDGVGNNADLDDDGDTVADETDNCLLAANPQQIDTDDDGIGNACDDDDPGIGLRWRDSDAESGPAFDWIDISATGTEITGLTDDNHVGPFDIGFDFMFYGDPHTQFYIQSNGVISFHDVTFGPENQTIPSEDLPVPVIAWMWDDLYPRVFSKVYYQLIDGDRLVIQYVNYGEYASESGRVNAQVIFKKNSDVVFQYLDFANEMELTSATVGVQNADGTHGMRAAYNASYLHDELAIVFSFDVDRDGTIEPHEFYTNAEEYLYGAPENWVTEFDGLRCSGGPDDIPPLVNPCRTEETRPTGEPGWLGTDPLDNDTDYYRWVGNPGQALGQTQKGDGIEDGWEIYFQLDPLNSSDALIDSDLDGWDFNRDGAVSPDTSSSTLDLGEVFSNLEEYTVYRDDGNWVTAGVKHAPLGIADQTVTTFDQGTTPSLLHHNAHSIFSDDSHGLIYVGTLQGVTVMNPSMNSSNHFALPSGNDLHDLHLWPDGGDDGILLLSTSSGLMTLALDADGQISSVVDEIESEAMHLITPLQTGSGGQILLLGFGADQGVWRITLDSQGLISSPASSVQLTAALQQQENTTVETAVHVILPSEGPRLFVGTDRGLLMANSFDFLLPNLQLIQFL